MTCANCGIPLNGKYRIVAFDRPRRVDVKACPGRCTSEVRGWNAERLELHIAEAIKVGSQARKHGYATR